MSNYDKCFEKHPFNELNNIDVDNFDKLFGKYMNIIRGDKKTVFFDVGCNAGSFIKVLKKLGFENNIFCFEPHPVLSKIVKEHYPYIRMNEFCLANYNGEITINIPTLSVGLSSIIRRPVFDVLGQEINLLTVGCKTLDSYCEENGISFIDFIKIDVEGAEKVVFEGAHNLLSSRRIKSGLFEIGQTLVDAGTSTDEVCNLIESYGYKLDKTLFNNDIFFYL